MQSQIRNLQVFLAVRFEGEKDRFVGEDLRERFARGVEISRREYPTSIVLLSARSGAFRSENLRDFLGLPVGEESQPGQVVELPREILVRPGQRPCQVALQPLVRGARMPNGVTLIVRDDGVGFDVETARRLGRAGERLGLVGMRERAEGIGADLDIVSSPGRGTEVRLVVPHEGVA